MVTSYKMDICHQEIKYLSKMNFGITQEIDAEASAKSNIIISFSESLEDFLANKDYGNDIRNFFIGCICVMERPGYEDWFKVRKPRYQTISKVKLLDGSIREQNGVFTYDIKLDFDMFVSATEEESKRILALEILNSLSNLDALPKKVKNFDKERFKSDIEAFFKSEKLI